MGLYSGKTKLAGRKKKKDVNESQVLCAEASAIGLSDLGFKSCRAMDEDSSVMFGRSKRKNMAGLS